MTKVGTMKVQKYTRKRVKKNKKNMDDIGIIKIRDIHEIDN